MSVSFATNMMIRWRDRGICVVKGDSPSASFLPFVTNFFVQLLIPQTTLAFWTITIHFYLTYIKPGTVLTSLRYLQQLPAATNAHGSSNSNQYPKPATYGSGYGSYDALNQSQDYTKGGYVGNTQGQKGSGANASSTGSAGNDLSAMYGKSHTALGKVNVSKSIDFFLI